jgi:hypothetical protein
LCGCEVNYDIVIDEELNVSEEISATFYGLNSNIEYEEEPMTFGDLYDILKEEYKPLYEENGYRITETKKENSVDILLTRNTKLINFKDPVLLKDLYYLFNTSCSEKFCMINANATNKVEYGDGEPLRYNIKITVPFKVERHNADYVDEYKNTYIWYNSNINEKKDLELVFYRSGTNVIKENEVKNKINTIILIIILAIIIVPIFLLVRKIIRNNKPRL